MSALGPLVLLVALSPAASAAGTCKKAPPPAGPFGAKFIGEGGGTDAPCPVQGDTGDFREEISRQAGEEARPGDVPVDTDHDSVAQPPALPPGRPVFPKPADLPPSAAPAQLPPSATPAVPSNGPANLPRWSWPGPESPEARRRRQSAEAPSKEKAGDEDEDLRDAPSSVSPERYSLWAGLSKPLLLSASKAESAAPAEAKALGERDYAAHILSQTAVDLPAPGAASASASSAPSERKPVLVELDVKDTPGEWKAGADALASAAGFEPDPAAPARFLGTSRARVVLSGTVLPERMGELLTVAKVTRVEAPPAAGPGAATAAETRVLVGLRLPTSGTPEEAVAKAAARLSESASFRFEKALAIQEIPGTKEKVLVIAGALPVRAMASLLSDPEVVKVAPSPAEDAVRPLAARALPLWKRALAGAAGDRRPVFLAAVLSCLALWGPFVQGRKRSRAS
ncbi:hypothetical protein EPO15_02915 [bacterium]|nr:MAG: hypothetical protein EPO15_02915 [bacterium]